MPTQEYSTPKNVFLHLLMIAMLYTSVISLMVLLTAYVNVIYPDPLDYYPGYLDTIRITSSILIVSFPIFILSNWLIGRENQKEVEKSRFRKWLIYLTLFLAAVTMVIYLISLVYSFYNGDLTWPFTLKVLVVLLISAFVFGYYIMSLQGRIHRPKAVISGVSVFVLASIVAGFFIVGSPMEQRKVRFDEQRVSDLSQIQWQIVNYWQYKEQLPQDLDELNDSLSGFRVPVDPVSGEPYEYRILSNLSFELCADFQAPSRAQYSEARFNGLSENFSHGIGETCFERRIDPDFYRNVK